MILRLALAMTLLMPPAWHNTPAKALAPIMDNSRTASQAGAKARPEVDVAPAATPIARRHVRNDHWYGHDTRPQALPLEPSV